MAVAVTIDASHAQQITDQDAFLAAGAMKLSTKRLEALFSDSKFVTRAFSVRNFADGSRIFKAPGYMVQLRWWIDGRGRFCTDTRLGGECCEVEYFLHERTLKVFTAAGETAQEFSVN